MTVRGRQSSVHFAYEMLGKGDRLEEMKRGNNQEEGGEEGEEGSGYWVALPREV